MHLLPTLAQSRLNPASTECNPAACGLTEVFPDPDLELPAESATADKAGNSRLRAIFGV